MSTRLTRFIACVLVLGTPGLLFAQSRATSADLAGTILDESKAVLPGVSLVVTHVDTGIERLAISDGEGRAVLATTVSQQQIEDLPINGRNFISFSLIRPGVMGECVSAAGGGWRVGARSSRCSRCSTC